jgi:hypothetical protein
MDVRVSLHALQQTSDALKLTTMYIFNGPKIYVIQTNDF